MLPRKLKIMDLIANIWTQIVDLIRNPDEKLVDFVMHFGAWAVYGVLFAVLFCETGLVVAPFLPGDSLLFICGYLASRGDMQSKGFTLPELFPILCIAVILGDSTNYWIGRFVGPKIFHRDDVRWLNREHLYQAHRFYGRHGGKTVVIARFMPILRTFSPFVAGIAAMNYLRFLVFSVTGTLLWIAAFTLLGYHFGKRDFVQKNFYIVVLAIIVISMMPALSAFLKQRRKPVRMGACISLDRPLKMTKGLDYVELPVAELLCPREDDEVFRQRLKSALKLPVPVEVVNVLFPGDTKLTGPDVNQAAIDDYFRTVCRRAKIAGVKMIVFGSGRARNVPDGFDRNQAIDQLVAHLTRWAPLAAQAGVTVVLEPLNQTDTNIVNSVAEGAQIVRRVNHPNIRLLADTYHMARGNEPPQAIRDAGGLLAHAHCADQQGRVPLGFGPSDHGDYFKALRDVGYKGRISIEASFEDSQLSRALAALRRQWCK